MNITVYLPLIVAHFIELLALSECWYVFKFYKCVSAVHYQLVVILRVHAKIRVSLLTNNIQHLYLTYLLQIPIQDVA